MNLYVVDTNLIFSAIVWPDSAIGKFFSNSEGFNIRLFAPSKLIEELARHAAKMIELSNSDAEAIAGRQQVFLANITIVPDTAIPVTTYFSVLPLVRNVDVDDIAFVALTEELDGLLVTGDRALFEGLRAKGYNKVISFKDLVERLD